MSREKVELTPEMIEDMIEAAGLTPDAPSYKKKLHWLGSQIAPNLHNAKTILLEDPRLRGLLSYDEFERKQLIHFDVPEYTGAVFSEPYPEPRQVDSKDVADLLCYFQCVGSYKMNTTVAEEAVSQVALMRKVHPVKDYWAGITWDGVPRVGTLLIDWLGAEATRYSEVAATLCMVGAVARVMQPGCKFDYTVILESPGGFRKGMFWSTLAGKWFSDGLPGDITQKDAAIHLHGKLIIECAELSAFKKNDAEHLKAFLTRQVDKYRPPYGRREVSEPRQCVFVGSTNEDEYLRDETGNRRFIPVQITKKLDAVAFAAVKDQLWAEAVALYNAGCPWYPDEAFEEEFMKPEQEARRTRDPWFDAVAAFVRCKDKLTYTQIAMAIGITEDRMDTRVTMRIRSIMKDLGWAQSRKNVKRYWWDPKKAEKK